MQIKTFVALLVASFCAMALEIVLPELPTMFEQTAAEELSLHLKDVYGGVVLDGTVTYMRG